jgi:hypothetical protein
VRPAVKAPLTPVAGSSSTAAAGASSVGDAHPEQLAFPIPPARLTEAVGLGGFRQVHAVPWMPATAKRLGLTGWPLRAFCGKPVGDTAGGTVDPSDIRCRQCLRALRKAGLL